MYENDINVIDFGPDSPDIEVDYPDYAHAVAGSIIDEESIFGILICEDGNGMSISANKWMGIRASVCWDIQSAIMSKSNNNSNIICLPANFINSEDAVRIVETFLSTEINSKYIDTLSKVNPNMF